MNALMYPDFIHDIHTQRRQALAQSSRRRGLTGFSRSRRVGALGPGSAQVLPFRARSGAADNIEHASARVA